ncbi:Uncharacterised protein [Mycobacterium tuberculosis]|nr:Uncharacterised protein [Mycobacterium tuberculosis]
MTPVALPSFPTFTCVTMQSGRTSAPARKALGMCTISVLNLAFGMQPCVQKPRLMQGGRSSKGADRMASGLTTQRIPSFSQPLANNWAFKLIGSRSG